MISVKTLKMRVANEGALGHMQPPLAFVQPRELKIVFTFLKGGKKVKRRIFCDTRKLHEIHISLSINRISTGTQPCPLIFWLSFATFALQ